MTTKTQTTTDDARSSKSTRSPRKLNKLQRLRIASLLSQPAMHPMDHPLFHEADAMQQIFEQAPQLPKPNCDWYHPSLEVDFDGAQNPATVNTLLTGAQERTIFLQFNYARFRALALHQKLSRSPESDAFGTDLLHWNDQAMQLRDKIIEFNLALVLAMAKHVSAAKLDFSELLSEGNMALLRAVDKFDVGRNFKFSTYACRAILKGYSRMSVKRARTRSLFPASFDPALETPTDDPTVHQREISEYTSELRRALSSNDIPLTPLERQVIEYRFPMEDDRSNNPPTLAEVGKLVGYSKERIRQIQKLALDKLRDHMDAAFGQRPFDVAGGGSL